MSTFTVEVLQPGAAWHVLYREPDRDTANRRLHALAQSGTRHLYTPHGGHRLRVREVAP